MVLSSSCHIQCNPGQRSPDSSSEECQAKIKELKAWKCPSTISITSRQIQTKSNFYLQLIARRSPEQLISKITIQGSAYSLQKTSKQIGWHLHWHAIDNKWRIEEEKYNRETKDSKDYSSKITKKFINQQGRKVNNRIQQILIKGTLKPFLLHFLKKAETILFCTSHPISYPRFACCFCLLHLIEQKTPKS
jgi:hypothetical protein